MTPAERRVLATTCTSHGLIHVCELSVPPLLILIQAEFGAGDLAMGRVVALYGLLFGLGALPAGWVVDRLGSRALLAACLGGAAVGLCGMALAPGLVPFAVAASIMGLALSIYHPAGTALITHAIPLSGRVFAWHGMAGNLGVASASAIAGGLGAWLGWRVALGVLAAAAAATALTVARLPAPAPHDIRARPGTGRWPGFVLLLLSIAFVGMVYRGMTTFLPKFLGSAYGDDPAASTALGAGLTTVALLVGLIGMAAAGRAIDAGVPAPLVFLGGIVLQAPPLVLVASLGRGWLVPLFMGTAFFHFVTQPAGNHLVAQLTPPRLRGLGYGIYFFVSFGVGAAGAVLGGWVSERRGLAAAFPAFAALLVPALLATLALALLERRRRAGETA